MPSLSIVERSTASIWCGSAGIGFWQSGLPIMWCGHRCGCNDRKQGGAKCFSLTKWFEMGVQPLRHLRELLEELVQIAVRGRLQSNGISTNVEHIYLPPFVSTCICERNAPKKVVWYAKLTTKCESAKALSYFFLVSFRLTMSEVLPRSLRPKANKVMWLCIVCRKLLEVDTNSKLISPQFRRKLIFEK